LLLKKQNQKLRTVEVIADQVETEDINLISSKNKKAINFDGLFCFCFSKDLDYAITLITIFLTLAD